jgi:peptide deformylase
MVTIIQKENPILRQTAALVPVEDIGSAKIRKVIRDMQAALSTQPDGVAIAAPQIGVSLAIFLVSGKIFDERWRHGDGIPPGEKPSSPDIAFINPEIVKMSKAKKWMHEGCLSVRPLWGEVERSTHATITAYGADGVKFKRGAAGLLAHIFQHETDHLHGILFIDKARNVAPGHVPELDLPQKSRGTRTAKSQ